MREDEKISQRFIDLAAESLILYLSSMLLVSPPPSRAEMPANLLVHGMVLNPTIDS